MIYIIIGSFLGLCSVIEFGARNKNVRFTFHQNLYLLTCILLLFFCGTRFNTGLDYFSYKEIFYNTRNGLSISDGQIEPLYWVLNKISPTWGSLVFLMAMLSCLPIFYLFYKKASNKFFCLFLFYSSVFIYFDMGIMRQGAAITLIFLSLDSYNRDKIKLSLLLFLSAVFFHMASFAAFPIFFLGKRRGRSFVYFFCLIFVFLLSLTIPDFILTIMGLVSKNFALAAYKFNAYTTYLSGTSDYQIFSATLFRSGLAFIFIFCFYFCIRKEYRKHSLNETIYVNAFFVSTMEFILMAPMPYFATRFSAILYYSYFFVYDSLVSKKFNKWIRLCFFMFAILNSFKTMTNTVFNSSGGAYIPYQTSLFIF